MTDITWSLLIHMASFLVFFLVFRRVFFRPLLRLLEEREDTISTLLVEAEDRREMAVEIEERCDARLKEAQDHASQILKQGERQAQKKYDEILSRARQQSDELLAKARVKIEAEKARALAEFEGEAVDMASIVAAKVLQREIDHREREQLQAVVLEAVRHKDD